MLFRSKEIIKIRAEINETENRRSIKTKSGFVEKINKIDTFLARLTRKKKSKQITNIRNESGPISTDSVDIKKIVKGGFPGGAVVKNPPASAGHMGLSPGPGRSHMPRSN